MLQVRMTPYLRPYPWQSEIGWSVDVLGVHINGLAERSRVATRSGTLADGFVEIKAAHHRKFFGCVGGRKLQRSKVCATVNAQCVVCWLGASGCVPRTPPYRMHASATTVLFVHEQQRDVSHAITKRASNFFLTYQQASNHSQGIPAIRCVSRATRPELAVDRVE